MRRLRPSGGLWSHSDFLKLWTGQTISEFGSQISQLAIPWVALVTLHATAFEVARLLLPQAISTGVSKLLHERLVLDPDRLRAPHPRPPRPGCSVSRSRSVRSAG